MLGNVKKLFVFKWLLTIPSNVLPLHLKQTFQPLIWIFTEGEGDGVESRLPFKIFSTLNNFLMLIILTQKFAFLHMMNYYFCSPPNLLTKWQVPSATFLWYVFKSIYHVLSTYLSIIPKILLNMRFTCNYFEAIPWIDLKKKKDWKSVKYFLYGFFYLQSRLNRVLPWENKLLRARKKVFCLWSTRMNRYLCTVEWFFHLSL